MIHIPAIKDIDKPQPFEYHGQKLRTGTDFYTIPSAHSLELVKIEVVLDRGRFQEEKRLSSRFCARMLKEGTIHYNSDAINDKFDFFGADFQVRYHLDYASFTLVSLKKHFPEVLPLFFEIIQWPKFDREELALLKKRAKSKLKLAEADNDAMSFRILTEKIFGSQHAYGYNSNYDDIDNIEIEDLYRYHEKNYCAPNFKVYLSGSVENDIVDIITEYLYKIPTGSTNGSSLKLVNLEGETNQPGEFFIKNNYSFDAQSSVKLGKRMLKRDHPDYIGMHFLNTIMGGFFGSRLMQNIREKKGLTYNIYSDLEPMKYDGYFIIGTDIKTENIKQVIGLIYDEIDILQNELIPVKEMNTVSNYIKGYLVSALDGVFSKAEIVKLLTLENMEVEWIYDFFDHIDNIKAEKVRQLAKNYLKKDQLFTVVVN
ncbi:M16 family metallopeptidase [Membranihabitans marinus]|uniref:M16 family metallopeptidase n=1 Tax=Membranihabitans marinus TaxID=1227546 RepID=UPI001F2ACB1E|nr:pitrilysin family protein [Membranihabitans marinus]